MNKRILRLDSLSWKKLNGASHTHTAEDLNQKDICENMNLLSEDYSESCNDRDPSHSVGYEEDKGCRSHAAVASHVCFHRPAAQTIVT